MRSLWMPGSTSPQRNAFTVTRLSSESASPRYLPFLAAKCWEYAVAPPEVICETVCKLRVVDLATASIGFLWIPRPVLHPCTHNELANGFLGNRDQKPTEKRVWGMADEKKYAAIEERCEGEVREMVALIHAMTAQCQKNGE